MLLGSYGLTHLCVFQIQQAQELLRSFGWKSPWVISIPCVLHVQHLPLICETLTLLSCLLCMLAGLTLLGGIPGVTANSNQHHWWHPHHAILQAREATAYRLGSSL